MTLVFILMLDMNHIHALIASIMVKNEMCDITHLSYLLNITNHFRGKDSTSYVEFSH
jgi:hypothetical protein